MAQSKSKLIPILICLGLALAVFAVFSPALKCDFINYDDPDYITENPSIVHGLTVDSIKWAFTTPHASLWIPLTWISHILDIQLFGLNPMGHHLTNIIIHALNCVLMFLLLRRMTGTLWPSAFIAAIFGLHPLRVESVVWACERKDVLSTLFWVLTTGAYIRYVQTPAQRTKWFSLALVFFALGLMSKPMIVTLPFVLLLLDLWPLKRLNLSAINLKTFKPLLLEKLPFIALGLISSVITILVARGATSSFNNLTFIQRLENAVIAYPRYIGKIFWPTKLAIFYPYPGQWPSWQIIASAIVLLAITAIAIRQFRARPYIAVGWFWFVGMLIPVIGLVQAGSQSMADRFSYVSSVGLVIAVTWAAIEFIRNRTALIIAALIAIATCCVLTPIQAAYWKNDQTLFTHAIDVTRDNYLAYTKVGYYLWNNGQPEQAIDMYKKAIEIYPDYDEAQNNMGIALAMKGQLTEAIAHFNAAIRDDPNSASAHGNLGNVYAAQASNLQAQGNLAGAREKFDRAITEFSESLRLKPEDTRGHDNLGNLLAQRENFDDAIREFRKSIQINPENPEAHFALGFVLARQGKSAEAETEYRVALKQKPNYPEATQQLSALHSHK